MQFLIAAEETDAIATVKRRRRFQDKPVAAHVDHAPHRLADVLGRIRRRHRGTAAVQKIRGVAAIEGLVWVGLEPERGLARRRAPAAKLGQQRVQLAPVMTHDVHHIRLVLQAPLDLEGRDPGLDQFAQPCAQVQIPQRKQVLVGHQGRPSRILQAIQTATGLRALAAVSAAAAESVAQTALPAHTHTQGAVDECLQLDAGGSADGADLVKVQLASQYGAREADLLPESHALRTLVVHLRAGNQRQRGQVTFQQPNILDDQPIHSRLLKLPAQPLGLGQLVVA